jgi:PHS family inorganic phosphate transporter-like MFS transporter
MVVDGGSGTMGEGTISEALDEAPLSRFHSRAVVTAGLGFFTDAYDLFIIGTASTMIAKEWGLSTSSTSFVNSVGLINSITLISAFLGAFFFGRIADVVGRKKIYGLEAALMAGGALASAFSPNVIWLVVFRFILGIGVGGDYPMSAVLMSEFANRRQRGRLVGLVFSMQALGTVGGYVAGLALVSTGMSTDYVWRILLALGAVPAAAVIYLRRKMPESPRYEARVGGRHSQAAADIAAYSDGVIRPAGAGEPTVRLGIGQVLSNPRYLLFLVGTAGSWFVFDYAYYGNSVSAPLIYQSVLGKHGAEVLPESLALALIVFAVAAVPGYYLACTFMDRIGHKRLQIIGFFVMGLAFLLIGVVPNVTTVVAPFLVLFGISYFFAEFGPNTTTFVLSAELYPTSQRTTGHGISAGIAKVGAFIGVYLFPVIKGHFGLSGTLELSAGFALVGLLLTLLLPETKQRSLDVLSDEEAVVLEAERTVAQAGVLGHHPDPAA